MAQEGYLYSLFILSQLFPESFGKKLLGESEIQGIRRKQTVSPLMRFG